MQLSLLKENILVFDIETQKGFGEAAKISEMGVSVAVSCELNSGNYKYYLEKDVPELIEDIFNSNAVIGYNIKSFDYNVLKGYTDKDFSNINSIDMMLHAQKSIGFRPKLDNLVGATLGSQKSADGLQALKWWREGKIDLIKKYCHMDVKLTKELYEFGKNNGFIYAKTKSGEVKKFPIQW